MSLQRFLGVRTANGNFGGFVWSEGVLKDNKYLPVISAQEVVEAPTASVVEIAVRYVKLPEAMPKIEALRYLAQRDEFKKWQAEIDDAILKAKGRNRTHSARATNNAILAQLVALPLAELNGLVDQLQHANLIDFIPGNIDHVPDRAGLYAIYRRTDNVCLHAGKTRTRTLRHRLYNQHRTQGGISARSDLIQKVQDQNLAGNRASAVAWIDENCAVKCIVVEDDNLRGQAELVMLDRLRPIWDRQPRPRRH